MNLFVVFYSSHVFSFTGEIVTTGAINLVILPLFDFNITSPLNGSIYYFNISDGNLVDGFYEFPIDVNITTLSDVTSWSYFVYSEDYGDYLIDVDYSPNSSVYFRSGWNNLTLAAVNSDFNIFYNETVLFYVNVSNSAPIINLIQGQIIYACEGEMLDYAFNVTDYDDELDMSSLSMQPFSPFILKLGGLARLSSTIFGSRFYTSPFVFNKADIGIFLKRIYVNDRVTSDSKNVTIQVLEVNDVPEFENMGSYLIYRVGDNASFIHQWIVNDVEDGDSFSGNWDFNLSYSDNSEFNLFVINEFGVMNFTADNNSMLGTYGLKACLRDNALSSPHENLSTSCLSDGGANVVCDDFFLTVTDTNRAPEIVSYLPNESFLTTSTGTVIDFSVSLYEQDANPVDFNWYLDGVLVNYNVSNGSLYSSDGLSYSFPCGVDGEHVMLINATDGELSDSVNWTVSVNGAVCTVSPNSGGGGSGGKSIWCYEEWACEQWNECLSVLGALNSKLLLLDDFYDYIDKCKQLGFNESICGFQIRNCFDLMNCSNDVFRVSKPEGRQTCNFVLNPSCNDGVKNCHGGDCELLIDCGGPCKQCATCSDGVKNQNEGGIDCGGPCPYPCEIEEAKLGISYVLIGLLILILGIVIVIMYFVYRFIMLLLGKREKEEKENKGFDFSGFHRKGKIKNLLKGLRREEER